MQYAFSHATQQWLKSFSSRLPRLVAPTHQNHIDQQVRADNLRHNLVRTLAHVIDELTLADQSKATFESALAEFNRHQPTALSYEELAATGWVRLINDEVRIPETVTRFLGQLGRAAPQGQPQQVPAAQAKPLEFLQQFYQQYNADDEPTIAPDALRRVLAAHADAAIDVPFLVEKGILREAAGHYCWLGSYYVRQLHDEIAALLWHLVCGPEATETQFRHYLRRLIHAGIWPHDWSQHLAPLAAAHLSKLAVDVLLSEGDLRDTGLEFTKIWFDTPLYADRNLTQEVPRVPFCHDSSWALLQSFQQRKGRFGEVFDYEPGRHPYDLLLRMATAPDPAHPVPFHQVLRLLRAADRPFVVRGAFKQLSTTNTAAIPYLLAEPQLLPLAFKALAKMALADFLVPEQADRDEQHRQLHEVLNELWLELFAGALDIIIASEADLPAFGEALGHTLYDLAEQLFYPRGSYSRAARQQEALLDRYMKALAALGARRITPPGHYYNDSFVPPRLVEACFPAIARALIGKQNVGGHSGQLPLDLAALDLGAELLKISEAPVRPGGPGPAEPDEASIAALEAARLELVRHLRDLLRTYLNTTVVQVETYTPAGPETRPASARADHYATERVNWGYLFLQLHRHGLLAELTSVFLNGVQLDRLSEKGKYEEANLLASQKLRLLLKASLLAYLTVQTEAIAYEAEGSPAPALLRWLEDTIERMATTYAHDDLPRARLDIFDESLAALPQPPHWTPLLTLLFKALNQFESRTCRRFLQEFFARSVDIGRMLTALNLLEARELQEVVSQRLGQIEVDAFIDSRRTVTDLETALVEAINSRGHWQRFARPLLLRVQQHFRERDYPPENAGFLFEIELLLAFKLQDSDLLAAVEEPTTGRYAYDKRDKLDELKAFYLALDQLYNHRNYPEAIRRLERLLMADARNVRYAFHRYRAKTLLALHT